MHTRASNSKLVEPLPEPERTLNQRRRRRNKRVPYDQRNNPPQHPRIIYPSILNINHFCDFLVTLENLYLMDDEPMWAVDRVVAPTPGFAITIPETANEFANKGNHLTLVKGNQFDGRTKTNPHKHIHECLRICDMFKYRDTENKVVRLMMVPLSLTGEAKTWLEELNKGTIETWDELRTAFISRFFPQALFDRLLREIRAFSQHENESLTDAWLRMKEMLRNCHGHNLSKGNIIKIFYHGLSEITQEVLNTAAGANLGASINLMPYSLYAKLSLKTLNPTKMSVRLADRSFQYPVGIVENMLVEVGKFTFPVDFVILEMEEDSKVPQILGQPFLHTTDAVIRVKHKQLNLRVGTERMILNIDSVMKHSYSNDDTCFSIDVIDKILEEDFDALLDKGSKILHSIEGTLLEEEIFAEFNEFMAMTADKNPDSKSDIEEPPFEKITINTDYKIKTSLEEPLTNLELKPLHDNLEYVFLEEPFFRPVIISSQLSKEKKGKLVSVLRKHKQAFA
uniref:Reverse transcriptase domain-containing protein n=1 Tax=Tanacetum cinerariifolium TaxID=118510 RepID=A0A6L2KDB6_TANCI|nr:reverse transcriptase domain-containing protein [Tanacetum cinerariifolium]